MIEVNQEEIRDNVKKRYGDAARRAAEEGFSCCGPATPDCSDPVTANLYTVEDTDNLPAGAVRASLVAIRLRWPTWTPGRRCSISAPAVVSTFCFPPDVSAPRARLMGWT